MESSHIVFMLLNLFKVRGFRRGCFLGEVLEGAVAYLEVEVVVEVGVVVVVEVEAFVDIDLTGSFTFLLSLVVSFGCF